MIDRVSLFDVQLGAYHLYLFLLILKAFLSLLENDTPSSAHSVMTMSKYITHGKEIF